MSSYRKDLKALAKQFDCKIEQTRGNHLRLVRQGQQPVIAPLTPSRAYRTLLEHILAGRLAVDRELVPLDGVATAWMEQDASPGRKLVISIGKAGAA